MSTTFRRIVAASTVVAFGALASAQTVYSNNPTGDNFTNPGGSGITQAVGASGWYYTNVRTDGVAGINTDYARSGNGSAHLSTSGAGNSKADVEYYQFNTPGAPTSGFAAMGTLGSLSGLSYDWYRNSSSGAAAHLHPALRVYFDADGNFATTTDQGYLVFERAYNPNTAAVPTDAWISDDVFNWNGAGLSANVWMVNFGNSNGSVEEVYNRTIQDWINSANPNGNYPSLSAQTAIFGVSSGVGSGWGSFDGAVDNISISFTGGMSHTWNFETQPVPEPASMAALGLGALALIRKRRNRKS
ncbi:MAG: hypothetical protein BGO01_07190 [Armatimonadetes bacterium 55-13]|nr:PEP-CTERM sorting domain-containing protein [Armatimonadota bacterium]ODU53878.1 MAG: hypothetical protein ABT09_00865 [bacterium SCN 57-13]OJU62284.1 MAG: hypothetical protein BGO01_07190 [Armatimonadetes bacterium 55-13]